MAAMTWSTWLNDNWFSLLQSIALVAGLAFTGFAIRANTKALQVQNLFTLTEQHRNIWSFLYSYPQLARILERNLDLAKHPITTEEEIFVRSLVLHLASSHKAAGVGLFESPENVTADIRGFFLLPVPNAIWKQIRQMQDREFVAYVESALRSESGT